MKEYVRPDVFVTEFRLNSTVAGCDPTTVYPEPQDLQCAIVAGEIHGVFYDGCGTNAETSGRLAEYQGQTYFIWKDGSTSGQAPDAAGTKLIAALGVQQGEHASVADAKIQSIINSSY